MMIKYILLIVLASLMPFWTFVVAPVYSLGFINFALIIGIILLVSETDLYIYWSLLTGFMVDTFSDMAFGTFMVALLLTLVFSYGLQKRYRRGEIFSLLFVATIAVLIFNTLLVIFTVLGSLVGISTHVVSFTDAFSLDLLFEIIVTGLFVVAGRISTNMLNQRSFIHI